MKTLIIIAAIGFALGWFGHQVFPWTSRLTPWGKLAVGIAAALAIIVGLVIQTWR